MSRETRVDQEPQVQPIDKEGGTPAKRLHTSRNLIRMAFVVGLGAALSQLPGDNTVSAMSPRPSLISRSRAKLETVETPTILGSLKNQENFPGTEWAVLGNHSAFQELGKGMAESKEFQEALKDRKEMTILYPASGVHLSPLNTVFAIAEENQAIEKYNLIYTEIDEHAYAKIDTHVAKIVEKLPQASNFKMEETQIKGEAKQKRISFQYTTPDGRTVDIEIVFEYKRSGEAYYLPEHFEQSDVIISHDMNAEKSNSRHAVEMFLESFADPKATAKPKFVLMEHLQPGQKKGRTDTNREIMSEAMGKIVHIAEGLPYSCGENHWDKAKKDHQVDYYKSAVLQLDTDLLKAIGEAGGKDALHAYAELANFVHTQKATLEEKEEKQRALVALQQVADTVDNLPKHKDKQKVLETIYTFLSERFFDAAYQDTKLAQQLRNYLTEYEEPEKISLDDEISRHMNPENLFYSKMNIHNHRLLLAFQATQGQSNDRSQTIREKLTADVDSALSSQIVQNFIRNHLRSKVKMENAQEGIYEAASGNRRDIMTMLINDVLQAICTLLYLGKKLDCSAYHNICQLAEESAIDINGENSTYGAVLKEICEKG